MHVLQKYRYYLTEETTFLRPVAAPDLTQGFAVKVRLARLPQKGEKATVLTLGALSVRVRGIDVEKEELTRCEVSDGYRVYADKTGFSPVLAATLTLDDPDPAHREMTVGVPLFRFDLIAAPLYIHYDGVCFRLIYQGEEINADYPFSPPTCMKNTPFADEMWLSDFGAASGTLASEIREERIETDMGLFSPRGYNTWAGDVVNFWHDGTYHLLYFFDRHHHGSRFGGGAHVMYHLTTHDFREWVDHGVLFPLTERWQTVGTGSMFYANGRYYYAYGWHTSRFVPKEKLASMPISAEFEKTGVLRGMTYAEIAQKGLVPNGANYVWSENGIDFKQGEVEFHIVENPAVYPQKDGTFRLYGGYRGPGTWEADRLDGAWRHTDPTFPPCGERAILHNTGECPCLFETDGYRYLLIGFCGFYRTEKGGDTFRDVGAEGYDVYDGLCVPMVAKTGDGRLILSGWLDGLGWGSYVAHRELIPEGDGTLGMRWLPEFVPDTNKLSPITMLKNPQSGAEVPLDEKASYFITCEVENTETGVFSVVFYGKNGTFRLYLDAARDALEVRGIAAGAELSPEMMPSTRRIITEAEDYATNFKRPPYPGVHFRSRDFSLEHVRGIGGRCTVRLLARYAAKSDNMVLDAEIAGRRTVISNRVGFRAERMAFFAENAALARVDVYKM